MHVSNRYSFLTLHFYSNSKLDPVNFELPEKHACLEKLIFTYLWLLSALGKFKHLVILAKVFSILLPSKRSCQWPTVSPHTSFYWLKKSRTTGYPFLLLCASIASMYSCAIIRLPCFILKVLLQFPAGCQLLASSESLKAVHLF